LQFGGQKTEQQRTVDDGINDRITRTHHMTVKTLSTIV